MRRSGVYRAYAKELIIYYLNYLNLIQVDRQSESAILWIILIQVDRQSQSAILWIILIQVDRQSESAILWI